MRSTDNDLFKNRYRIKSTRLANWDYSSDGYYFITICTHNRGYYFGEIGEMTKIGKIAQKYWLEIPNHFPFVILNEFVIMPNHIHGILIIENAANFLGGARHGNVETRHGVSLQQGQTNNNQFSKPVRNSLSMVINHYKGTIKRYCNKNNIVFAWQSRFYEHIIRDENELCRIKEYIIYNPCNWNNDKLFGKKD